MKRQNSEVGEVTPGAVKVVGPIAEDTIDDGAQIELGAESVEHQTTINARGGKGSLVDLKGVGALRRLHCRVDDRVKLDDHLVNLNRLEGPGNKHIVRLWSGGTRHGNGSATVLAYWKGDGGQPGMFKAVTTGNRAAMTAQPRRQ